uniref:Uncharacterized protein n=1 Tax=Phaseolus vulgaris TaxID=3885 RepID=V7B3Y2_PHAVU|nr:hypothetical protein PHAVU_008G127300g [Phaseolus vulgaris]ESW12612.1 hypothetical protein PHAVU_008G127300g [Phaseolus vulgaris]
MTWPRPCRDLRRLCRDSRDQRSLADGRPILPLMLKPSGAITVPANSGGAPGAFGGGITITVGLHLAEVGDRVFGRGRDEEEATFEVKMDEGGRSRQRESFGYIIGIDLHFKVTTQDDYILNLPRIRVGELRGTLALLQYGLYMVTKTFISKYMSSILLLMLAINVMLWLQNSITWLLLPSKNSLAFLLADNGFDVWVV